MHIALVVVSALLVIILLSSAGAKLAKVKPILETMSRVGVPTRALPLLAAAEIAGAVGLVVGYLYWPIGVAAAVGVILYFIGAVISHVRVKDAKNAAVPAAIAILAVVELALLISTHS